VANLSRAVKPRNQSVQTLQLWAWADARLARQSHQSLAVCVIARRFGLPPIRAALVAELAGLNIEAANV
jgi:hypothetical protein